MKTGKRSSSKLHQRALDDWKPMDSFLLECWTAPVASHSALVQTHLPNRFSWLYSIFIFLSIHLLFIYFFYFPWLSSFLHPLKINELIDADPEFKSAGFAPFNYWIWLILTSQLISSSAQGGAQIIDWWPADVEDRRDRIWNVRCCRLWIRSAPTLASVEPADEIWAAGEAPRLKLIWNDVDVLKRCRYDRIWRASLGKCNTVTAASIIIAISISHRFRFLIQRPMRFDFNWSTKNIHNWILLLFLFLSFFLSFSISFFLSSFEAEGGNDRCTCSVYRWCIGCCRMASRVGSVFFDKIAYLEHELCWRWRR